MTPSCHRCLGLPTGLVPIGFQSSSLLGGLIWSIHYTGVPGGMDKTSGECSLC
jgi:hypothetical protein